MLSYLFIYFFFCFIVRTFLTVCAEGGRVHNCHLLGLAPHGTHNLAGIIPMNTKIARESNPACQLLPKGPGTTCSPQEYSNFLPREHHLPLFSSRGCAKAPPLLLQKLSFFVQVRTVSHHDVAYRHWTNSPATPIVVIPVVFHFLPAYRSNQPDLVLRSIGRELRALRAPKTACGWRLRSPDFSRSQKELPENFSRRGIVPAELATYCAHFCPCGLGRDPFGPDFSSRNLRLFEISVRSENRNQNVTHLSFFYSPSFV